MGGLWLLSQSAASDTGPGSGLFLSRGTKV